MGETMVTSLIGMTPATLSVGVIETPMARTRPMPDNGLSSANQSECIPVSADPSMLGHGVVSPISSGHIIGEGAAIFMDNDRNYVDSLGPTDGFIN